MRRSRWLDDTLFRPEVRDGFHWWIARGCFEQASPGRADLHLLGSFPEYLCPERWVAHRSPAAQPVARRPARRGRRWSARCAAEKRPATTAPIWIDLADTTRRHPASHSSTR